MDNGVEHKMVVNSTYPTGAQEWYCPQCGRRYVMQWPPAYSKIILEVGDEEAIHLGTTGKLEIGRPSVSPDEDVINENQIDPGETAAGPEDPYLSPFSDWLSDNGH